MSQTSTLVELNKAGIAKLANNTIFRIAPGHLERATEWTPGMELVVERSNNATWQFVLKNATTGEQWVSATPSSGKVYMN